MAASIFIYTLLEFLRNNEGFILSLLSVLLKYKRPASLLSLSLFMFVLNISNKSEKGSVSFLKLLIFHLSQANVMYYVLN